MLNAVDQVVEVCGEGIDLYFLTFAWLGGLCLDVKGVVFCAKGEERMVETLGEAASWPLDADLLSFNNNTNFFWDDEGGVVGHVSSSMREVFLQTLG